MYATVILSFLIPWVTPYLISNYYHPNPQSLLARLDAAIRSFRGTSWLTEAWANHTINVFIIVTLATCFVLVVGKCLYHLIGMYRFFKDSTLLSKNEQYTLRSGTNGKGSFCFFKTIYLHSPSLSTQNIDIILEHEKAHIRQCHYIDLWVMTLCDCFFWFFPFIKRFQKAWEEVLECLADREAIDELQIKPIAYQTVLYSSVEYNTLALLPNSAFGRTMIAQRMLFLSKKPSCRKRMMFKMSLPIVAIGLLTMGLALVDEQVTQLQKINHIRESGYNLEDVTTGYVLDNKTGKPVSNAFIKLDKKNVTTVSGDDGFFFIEKSKHSKINVLHIAYNYQLTPAAEDLIIRVEPSIYRVSEEQYQNRYIKSLGRKMMAASFSSGHTGYQEYISQNLQYPEEALENRIDGTVWLTAEIDADGSVKEVRLFQGVTEELNEEAIRLVKNMPKWNPARQNDICTQVKVLVPVRFAL